MSNTHLTIEEIMTWLQVHPELTWEEQLKGLHALEDERKIEGNSVSHWGIMELEVSPEQYFRNLPPVKDNVNSPAHYSNSKIECITYLEDTLGDGITYYLEGNIKKYLHRWRYKNGVEDLRKAQWYLNKLIEIEGEK